MISFRRRIVAALGVLLVLGLADYGLSRARSQFDLTSENSQTLTEETKRVAEGINGVVNLTAFFARADPDRVTATSLLLRYRRLNSRIGFRMLDPTQAPAEAARLGVDPVFGGIAAERGGAVELAKTPTEQDVTAALARLERGKPARVCLSSGHGESDPASTLGEGFKGAAELLERNGYKLQILDLLTRPLVPSECEALLIANPTGFPGTAVADYLKDAGRAVILTDPIFAIDWSPAIEPFGLRIERGIVLEGDPNRRFPDDPTRPVVPFYRSPSPIVNRLPPSFFPGVQAVVESGDDVSGLVTTSLAATSDRSYLERQPLEPSFDEATDIVGPINIAAAADLSGNFDGRVVRTRLVVFGDSDFASNAFIGEAGNSTFLVRALDWAILEEDLVSVSANLPLVRPLELTEGRILYARLLLSAVVPSFFLLGGAMMWAARRRR